MKRKITSILAADVADFSRLVAEDEEDTLARLVAAQGVFKTHIVGHGGRIFNTAGDAILAEFASAVEAVRAATAIQAQLHTDNTDYAASRRLAFRMGVSIGDVVEHGDDLLGDGVNIAARLQGLAPAGGLAVSNWVHEQIAGKLDLPFRDIGRQALKNIPGAVQVYLSDLSADSGTATKRAAVSKAASRSATSRSNSQSPKYALAAGLVLLLGIGGYLAQRTSRAPVDTAVVAPPPAIVLPPAITPATPPPTYTAVPYPNLPEPAPPGPPSSSGSPESDRPPATPVVLQPLPSLPTALPRTQPNDDTTATPPALPPAKPTPAATPPAAAPIPTRILIPLSPVPLPPVSPPPVIVQPVAIPPVATPAVLPPKSEPTFTLASPPRPVATPSAPVASEPDTPPPKTPPSAAPSSPQKKSPTAAAAPKRETDPRRRTQLCREIVERVQMGETLSSDDRDFLRTQCS